QASTLRPGVIRHHASAAVVGKDSHRVKWCKRSDYRSQTLIDLDHHIGRQAWVDDESSRNRKQIHRENRNTLAHTTFITLKLTPGETSDKYVLLIAHHHRHIDKRDAYTNDVDTGFARLGDLGCFPLWCIVLLCCRFRIRG